MIPVRIGARLGARVGEDEGLDVGEAVWQDAMVLVVGLARCNVAFSFSLVSLKRDDRPSLYIWHAGYLPKATLRGIAPERPQVGNAHSAQPSE